MAQSADTIIPIIKLYIEELQKHNISVQQAILFGSYVKGSANEDSDIDIALVSESFTGNRFDDRRVLVPLRRKIDNRIEPMPFRSDDFSKGGNLIDEIRKTGLSIQCHADIKY